MEVKTCSKCGETKSLDEFHKRKDSKDGHRNSCKACMNECNKKYSEANKEQIREYKKKWHEANKDKERERKKKWHEENKDKKRERDKKRYEANKDKILEQCKKYREANKDKRREYHRERCRTDPNFRLAQNLRCRARQIFKGKVKPAKTLEMLGCSLEAFRAHLEAQFTEGMSWDNYGMGGWHLDHIRPCASFDLSDPDAVRVCFHFSNYQPMWESENCRKGSLYEGKRYTYSAGV